MQCCCGDQQEPSAVRTSCAEGRTNGITFRGVRPATFPQNSDNSIILRGPPASQPLVYWTAEGPNFIACGRVFALSPLGASPPNMLLVNSSRDRARQNLSGERCPIHNHRQVKADMSKTGEVGRNCAKIGRCRPSVSEIAPDVVEVAHTLAEMVPTLAEIAIG